MSIEAMAQTAGEDLFAKSRADRICCPAESVAKQTKKH